MAYIWLSGVVAARMAMNVHDLERIERIKGFVFVATTASLLVLAAWIMLRRLARAIEDRERLRQATVSAQSRVLAGELAAAVAHDFNNVLTVAQFALDEIRGEGASKQALLADASEALAQGRGLAVRLVNTARGERAVRLELRDVVPVVRSMLRALGKVPRLVGCALEAELCGEAEVRVDVLLFEQILANLVLNAGDAAGRNGRVRVVLRRDGPAGIALEVHDNGPGVPEQRRASIFNAFETSKADGLGLGLLSVRTAAETQGGSVEVARSPLGGALFIVRLPGTVVAPVHEAPGDTRRLHDPVLAKA